MIEIACITDTRFARHTAAMLQSALSATEEACRVHVLHDGSLETGAAARLREVVECHRGEFRLLPVPPERTVLFPSGYFPRAVWLRVLLPELLPSTARILYLDSDLVVADSLTPLWATDLGGLPIAAVTNPFYPFMPDHPRLRLGIEDSRQYLNSGVLLMDLESLRHEGFLDACIRFARENPGADYPDQDCLNHVCRGRWHHLHPRWNVQSTFYELPPARLPLPAEAVADALAHPAIIHFIGPFKPWHYMCRHPQRERYFRHAAATPWGPPALEGRSLSNAVVRYLPLKWIDRIERIKRRLTR